LRYPDPAPETSDLEQIATCVDTQASPLKQAGFWSVASTSYPKRADRTAHVILAACQTHPERESRNLSQQQQ
jgi:hypothetical protein